MNRLSGHTTPAGHPCPLANRIKTLKNIKEMPAETFPIKPSQFRQQAAKAVLGYVKKKFSTFFSEEDKEDIISEVVLRMWRAMDLYDSSKGALSTWVGTIAENVVKSMAKAKNKREAISGEITEEDEESFYEQNTFRGYEFAADRDILLEELENSLFDRLKSERDKRFLAWQIDGLDAEEMARREGISKNNAYLVIYHMRKRLSEAA